MQYVFITNLIISAIECARMIPCTSVLYKLLYIVHLYSVVLSYNNFLLLDVHIKQRGSTTQVVIAPDVLCAAKNATFKDYPIIMKIT